IQIEKTWSSLVTPQNLGQEVLGLEQGNGLETVYKIMSALVVKGPER
ncbi:hypothetical protein Gohar_018528, partial [Gossypium harknessii]|nr:hypothetical protein [Gossypium harknessii]